MAMNFWEAQRKARKYTTIYLCAFILLTIAIAVAGEIAFRIFAQENYNPDIPFFGIGFLILTFGVAAYNYSMYRQYGGGYVAESLGAYLVPLNTRDPKEKRLLNIVQETALASSLPVPDVYILPAEEINAFAAGLTQNNAAITVTEGALQKLSRDEMQGVIAHEFGHVYNGDMLISMRLAAMIMGFFFVLYIGLRLLGSSGRSRDENGKGGNSVAIAAIILILAGAITWFVGSLLKAAVSRQREYLADASAVQFTRNPNGIANALRKISDDSVHDMPRTGSAFSHMYLEDHASIFATHPPIEKRIAAIEGQDNS